MTLAPGTKLGPYEILAPIGAGGMGEVWKARDTRLGRIVAIKKVKEQHSERFKQEARSIAALNHPYICQLHDIGPDYLILEYIEGKPIPCPLPEKEAVRLAIQIATALEAAHKKGIIHRDLKPGNIMVTDEGSVKLLDFGLAKLYEQSASESTVEFPATQAGAVVGTVAYMSPEQAQGQPADARSDIFSFGLVLYETLSGKRAFAGDSTPAVMAALLRDEPPPLQTSTSLEKIIRRCLAKQPSRRYQTMAEARTALEQVSREVESKSIAEAQPSIAVLPFVNMSGDKEQEYFSDGLAEEIINALTQIPGLKVIARTSAFAFKDKREDITKIAEALRVSNILEGSVRKAGNRIRVTAQLITAADGSHLWSERYDREMTDVFAIQDEIAQTITEKLRVRLAGSRTLVKRRTGNMDAYNLCLKGKYLLLRFTPENLAKSKECFEQAITADPKYALPWALLANFHSSLGGIGIMSQKAANVQCRQAVLKALELDDSLPEAHSTLACLLACEYDWKGAECEFRRALDLCPEGSDVSSLYSLFYLTPMGRLEEAAANAQRALELDPLSPMVQLTLGTRLFLLQQYDRAVAQYHNALELHPHFPLAHFWLGFAYIQQGKLSEGIRAVEAGVQLIGGGPLYIGILGFAYAQGGQTSKVQKILEQLQEVAKSAYVSAIAFALVYLGLGDMEKGFDWLEKAVEEQDLFHIFHFGFLFDPIRSHSRYHALLRKMNLEP